MPFFYLAYNKKEREALKKKAMASAKQCTKCLKKKPIDAFFRRKRSADGHFSCCKECHRKFPSELENAKVNLEKRYRGFET